MIIKISKNKYYYKIMEIRENKNIFIIAPLSKNLTQRNSKRIFDKASKESRQIAIDLNYVSNCSIEFIEDLKKFASQKTLGIFNIPSDLFVLFNIMELDKSAKLFVSELDFEENSRQLINRKFAIV